jgi:hypothetical protein
VSRRLGCCCVSDGGCMQVFEAAGHTCGRLSGLVGLTMSSVAGDRMSLMLSSLTSFSCASSSICGGVSPARCNAQVRALPRCGRCCRCHCCRRATGRRWPDTGWAAQGGPRCLRTWANPLACIHADGGGGGRQHMGCRTYLRRRAQMGPASWASPCRG